MDLLSRAGRWARRATAIAVGGLGVVDLAHAAMSAPPRHAGILGLDYVAAAIVGARYGLLAAGLVAVLAVRALLHGKRTAWWLALAAGIASVPSYHIRGGSLAGAVVACVAILTLLACRPAFVARTDPALARRGLAVLFGGEAVVFGYAVVGLYFLDEHFRSPNTLRSAPGDAARMLFLLPVRLEPVTRHGRWFVDSVRVAALAVALIGLAWLVATVVGQPGHARDRAVVLHLLDEYATTALAHFHLLDDKAWLISSDRRAFVGYKVVGTTAVALGEPVGAPDSVVGAAVEFLRMCTLNGWTAVFHQVTDEGRLVLERAGLKSLKIGEEAIVDVGSFSLVGREHRAVRQAVNRVERAGCRLVELRTDDDETMRRLREVSDAWLASGGHRERTFTLGRFDRQYLRDTPVVAVLDADDRIQAFANILPRYRSDTSTFDLMRRRPDAVNGVMDYLFVKLIERFAKDGSAGMNLGLAPLAGAEGDTLPGRALRLLYERGGRAFNFAGLYAFKDKWHPRWEPRYLAYRSDAELPKAAAAVARAGELPDPRNPMVRLAGVVRRYPFTTAFAGLQAWLMSATALDASLRHELGRSFGLAWQDLTHGHLWRLATSPLIQARPGLVWSNALLLALIVPLAEWRLGSRRTVVTFFAGDWSSTLPVLVALRIGALLGSAGAAAAAFHRDLGTSSGMWSLAAATAFSLPAGRWRRIATGAVFAILVGYLIYDPQLFAVQHLVSAGAVVAAYWGLERRRRGQS